MSSTPSVLLLRLLIQGESIVFCEAVMIDRKSLSSFSLSSSAAGSTDYEDSFFRVLYSVPFVAGVF
jgi:hypothetical protein